MFRTADKMRPMWFSCSIAIVMLGVMARPLPIYAQTMFAVCHQPNVKCTPSYSFESYHLPFALKEKLVFGKTYWSQPFYAVVLKTVKAQGDAECFHVTEDERLEAQAIWPTRKVFASRFSCPEELVHYENADQDFNFLAVYAGTNITEARRVLTQVRKNKRFWRAYIKRMQVVLDYST